ncbi:unnamed protein product, partial [Didymodactylos carnosus]
MTKCAIPLENLLKPKTRRSDGRDTAMPTRVVPKPAASIHPTPSIPPPAPAGSTALSVSVKVIVLAIVATVIVVAVAVTQTRVAPSSLLPATTTTVSNSVIVNGVTATIVTTNNSTSSSNNSSASSSSSSVNGTRGSSGSTAVIATSTVLGCYADFYPTSRSMPDGSTTSTSNTPSTCIAYCTSLGFPYSGTEYADECHCSAAAPTTLSTACTSHCAGNLTLICGGANALSVVRST